MSEEGELKKRINSHSVPLHSIEEISKLKDAPDKRKVTRDWISIKDERRCWKLIFADLDEAKKEFPTRNQICDKYPEKDGLGISIQLDIARREWFEKWFGSTETEAQP